jgi:phosphotransferase system enzyme I (PtsI)
MQVLQGIAVSPGVAIGEALVMGHEGFRIPRRFVARDAVEHELDRLDRAIATAGDEIQRNRDAVSGELGEQYAAIFDAHLRMLRDARLRSEIETLISQRHYSPEYAVSRALRRYAKVFQSIETSYLAERVHDIYDIEKRLLRHLLGRRREEISHLTSPVVILAHNLTPSETANLDRTFVRGFVTEIGGPGSHTAIVAAGMEIPAVVGTGPFLTDVSGGDLVIIDGDHGKVILQPDEEAIARYRHEAEEHRTLAARLETLRDLPAETVDGTHIDIFGNIEFPYEVKSCTERGGDGVGLYRTEFLYLGREQPPTEEDHYQAYAEVVRAMGERPVVIRTLDLGADKIDHPSSDDKLNPCLGLRSIRLSLRDVPLFRTQLRAILRASVLGNVRMMFPMVTTLVELRQARMILADVMEDLDDSGTPFNRQIPVGMMVEVPSTAIMLDVFVKEVDFLSIGTNDLVQYTLAADRANKDVAALYNAADPAVIRLLRAAIRDAARGGVPISLCGQMSGQTKFTMLLLGLGLRQFSVTPTSIPEIKKVCRSVTIEQCERLSDKVKNMEIARNIETFLKEELKKTVPELAI